MNPDELRLYSDEVLVMLSHMETPVKRYVGYAHGKQGRDIDNNDVYVFSFGKMTTCCFCVGEDYHLG